jgi:hypothetical protein
LGGISHIDSFDLKPDAPSEIRGVFQPIHTNVPGIDICELLPKVAQHADKFSIVRSMHGFFNEHTDSQADSGWPTAAKRPGIGAVVSKVLGPSDACPISSVSLGSTFVPRGPLTSPGYLGSEWKDFEPFGLANPGGQAPKMSDSLQMNLPKDRFASRTELLSRLESLQQRIEGRSDYSSADAFTRKAMDVVLSGSMAEALDIEKESPRTLAAYGLDDGRNGRQVFLMARRLVEAGVRVVTTAFGAWDTHYDNFGEMKRKLPDLDIGLSGLLSDLHDRGMLEETLVIVTTEFGRTPRVDAGNGKGPGRSHWPSAGTFLIAGGGTRMGQVVGSTNRLGEMPENDPVHLQEFFATVYRQLGIDVNSVMLHDTAGRPHALVDHRRVVEDLI